MRNNKMKYENTIVNEYTLRSKDTPLVDFLLQAYEENFQGAVKKNYEIVIQKVYEENRSLLPMNLQDNLTAQKLKKWVEKRKAPKNRQFVDKIVAAIEDSDNPMKYVDTTHALSLNDAYWITNKLTNHKWKDFNLYHNNFDEILAYVAFTGYSQKVSGVITTPELTSGGALKKCWSNREDGIYLIKGDDFVPKSDKRSQITNEFYAAQVADVMGLDFISYDLEEFQHKNGEKELVCKCKLFTTEDVGFIDAHTYLKHCGITEPEDMLTTFTGQMQVAELCGKQLYADMMLFDSIIGNRDRHTGNFGMLVNNNTGDVIKLAPIFDNGISMLYGAAMTDLLPQNISEYKKGLGCKYLSFDEQSQLFVEKRHLPLLKKLCKFCFIRHAKYNISKPTLKLMEEFVRERAARAIELYNEKQKKLLK